MDKQESRAAATPAPQQPSGPGVPPMPVGAYALPGRVPDPRPAIAQAVEAERLGLSTIWLSERWGTKDFGVLAGAFGQVTRNIGIGAGITHFQSRHPALLASLAMTAQSLSEGRLVLGIGRSVDKMWRAVGLPVSTRAAIVDSADIFRRLCRGERVSYTGAAGNFPSLRLTDVPDVPVPPLVFAAIGPKGLELAGRHFDGVILHPFLTPEAVRRSVATVRAAAAEAGRAPESVRVYATVVVAPALPAAEEVAVVGARAVTYYQIPVFGEQLARVNGWDTTRLADLRNHPLLAGVRGSADSVLTRDELAEVASALPEEWIRGAAALGTPGDCWTMLERYRDAGADELVLHGTTPDKLAGLLAAAR